MKKYYLAYGSNLNIAQMQMRCPHAKVVGTAVIKNYELLFKGSRTGSYLTIEKCENKYVPVAVWQVDEFDELRLDRYEGYPSFYYKTEMEINVNGKKVKAFVYITHEDRPLGIPSRMYLETCVDGYRAFGFKVSHLITALNKSKGENHNERN